MDLALRSIQGKRNAIEAYKMRILILFFGLLASLLAQTSTSGKVTVKGTTQMSAAAPAPFNILTLASRSLAPTTTLFTGFPTVSGHPAQGYQGGIYVNNLALFTPWQWSVQIKQGTLLGYSGGPSGTFQCTNPTSCAANWDWFDMSTLALNCPATYVCPAADSATGYVGLVLANGIVYYTPDAANQFPVFMAFNPFGSAGPGGTSVSNAANYTSFSAPTAGTSPLGRTYGWCTAVFDGRYVYYAPTNAGAYKNANFVRYDTTGAFAISNFQNFDLSTLPGGAINAGFESSAFDGQRVFLLPTNGGDLVVYDTTQSFTNASGTPYKVLNLANLGTAGYPAVIGTGNLHAVQTQNDYIGGQMAWNPAGTIEYLYMAPFASNTSTTSHATSVLLSTVLRVPVATCSSPAANTQACPSGFASLDITASTSTWEMFDLANLTTNQAWATAGFAYPPLFAPPSPLTNQLTIGAFQLTWLNVHTPSDPIVGLVADYGNYYLRHHVSHTLSDPSGWDVGLRPGGQTNGCMGGGYDAVNQLLYPACPPASPIASVWQIGPL
jgi:hypothetical protein